MAGFTVRAFAAIILVLVAASPVLAELCPARAITMVVPFAPGTWVAMGAAIVDMEHPCAR
jgi:tripartite-type tricarboxylate transporter receptor subunit TctC